MLVLSTLRMAARTAAAEGHCKEAEAIFRRLADLIERQIGRDSEEYASCLHELGDVCMELKLWEQAAASYESALASCRLTLSERVLLLRSLAEAMRHGGKTAEARHADQAAAGILAARLSRRA